MKTWLLLFVFLAGALTPQDPSFYKIEDGLFIGKFASPQKAKVGDSLIHVIRIDPKKYQLRLLTASEYHHENLTVKEWCHKYNLIAAINAGMFQADYRSNVGYMKNYGHVNNPRISKKYLSAAAFNPLDPRKPPFVIFDTDEIPMAGVLLDYQTVIQNLRLVKRSRNNTWPQQANRWSEAALGEDKSGNVLFIFSRSPYSMHDLNDILLALPLDIECAQHLEGGPEASLYFSRGSEKLELQGSYEKGFNETDNNREFWPVPNVLGVVKK